MAWLFAHPMVDQGHTAYYSMARLAKVPQVEAAGWSPEFRKMAGLVRTDKLCLIADGSPKTFDYRTVSLLAASCCSEYIAPRQGGEPTGSA